ncbi:MAG: CDP-glucose 4,6-dehydratase [Oscillospiraceae bacterium]|nr:CDP-glucose 4,6-dehydratase [Oscillospiraceae bacterium]
MNNASFWRGKRVFLTGHTGFKGSWLCKILEIMGAKVTGYALSPPAGPNLFDIVRPDVNSAIGDIRDFASLLAAYKKCSPEVVIHMAAQPLVIQGYREPAETYEINVMGTVNLLECVRLSKSAKSVLNVTTDKVYLNRERRKGYREDDTLCGHDPYSNSKSCSEIVTRGYQKAFLAESGIALSTARSGNVIGGGDFAANRLLPDCARAAANGEKIVIRNPNSVRPYQHVLDTLFAYLLIARRQYEDPTLAGSYNIGPQEDGCLTGAKLADLFCEAWGEGAGWEHLPANTPRESGLLTLDCSKIRRTLGWLPRLSLEEAVKAAAEWYKAYYGGSNGAADIVTRQIKEFALHGIKTGQGDLFE